MAAPPVLLLHGFATSAERTWRTNGWIDLLTDAGRTVLAPDLLGHGDAPKPHDPTAYTGIEDAVVGILPDEPIDAIGFSLGARVLLTIAAAAPHRFNRIVVAGIGANLFRGDDHGFVRRAVLGEPVDGDPVASYFASLASTPDADPKALAAVLERPVPPLTPAVLAAIDRPVLVVLGTRDFAGPADPLVDALPNARLVNLSGVDHFATPKDFRFMDAALDFIGAT